MGWVYFGFVLFGLGILIGAIVGFMADGFIGLIGGVFVGGFAGFLLAILPISWGQTHYNERTVDCFVKDKDRGGNDDGMRVYTSCGVFQNTDSLLRGKNTSGDIWSQIKPGTEQQFRVVGWRLGLTSDFPNILAVE